MPKQKKPEHIPMNTTLPASAVKGNPQAGDVLPSQDGIEAMRKWDEENKL